MPYSVSSAEGPLSGPEGFPMRLLCFLFLLAFAGAAILLAVENQEEITLSVFGETITTSVPILVAATYLLGMFSGWTVVGMVRRSLNRLAETPSGGHAHAR